MSTKADVVLGRQDHVERDHRRERRAQVLLEATRDTQHDDGSVGGFVSKKLSTRFVEIQTAAVEEESYPRWNGDPDFDFYPEISTACFNDKQRISPGRILPFLFFPLPSRLICQIVSPCVGFIRLSL